MRGTLLAIAALTLSACESQPQPHEPTSQTPAFEKWQINFNEGSPVEVAVFKDTTGCEWLASCEIPLSTLD